MMINFARNMLDKTKAIENIDDDRTENLYKKVNRVEAELGLDGSQIEADAEEDNEINQILNQGQNLIAQVDNMNKGADAVVAHQKAEAEKLAAEVEAEKSEAHKLEGAENGATSLRGASNCLAIAILAAFLPLRAFQ